MAEYKHKQTKPNMKYLSAKQLKITPVERIALLKVKRFLTRIPMPKDHKTRKHHRTEECVSPAPALFNMNRPIAKYDCGTGCCIGGWMVLAVRGVRLTKVVKVTLEHITTIERYVQRNHPVLGRLFFPRTTQDYDGLTPQHAQQEIVTFLRTGKATW